MINVVFEDRGVRGNLHFQVHLSTRLRSGLPREVLHNAHFDRDSLTEVGLKISAGIAEVPGIASEIMVGIYTFETGISPAFDIRAVIEQVLEVILEATGEPINPSYLIPELDRKAIPWLPDAIDP